jgi:hypothetical protein
MIAKVDILHYIHMCRRKDVASIDATWVLSNRVFHLHYLFQKFLNMTGIF